MAEKTKKSAKRTRNKPCKPAGVNSRGTGHVRRHKLTSLEKVLLGKGAYVRFRYDQRANR